MIQNESKNEQEARRFLLGEMSESERLAFEQSFIVHAGLFEQTRVLEDELIESYVRGTLRLGEKEAFERGFLSTKRRRNRVEFARVMIDKLGQQERVTVWKGIESAVPTRSAWDLIATFCKTPQFAFGAVFAVLILVVGGWWLLRDVHKAEIVRQSTPPPINKNTQSEHNPNQSTNQETSSHNPDNKNIVNGEAREKGQNSNIQKEDSTGRTPTLALFVGTVRGEGKLSELNLLKDTANVSLQLNLESEDYKIYRVEIADANGKLLYRLNNLKARHSRINLTVPAAKLPGGDYLVKLSARNQRNEVESVADYPFRVNRQ